jgi:hypothetical protein
MRHRNIGNQMQSAEIICAAVFRCEGRRLNLPLALHFNPRR